MRALDVGPADAVDEVTHGFHAYPARMHPWTARRIVSVFSRPGDVVLDPFAGSGTVLVEARLAGRVAVGGDVHPLAVRLATLKSTTPARGFPKALASAASRVSGRALQIAKESRGERIPGFEAARAFWQPHVARDLLALQAAVRTAPTGPIQDALWLVLSSLAVKVSDRASDTDARSVERRIAAGAAPRLFLEKATELASRLEHFAKKVPDGTPPPSIETRDARVKSSLGAGSVALVLTSPPYPATYDYADHHAMRVWLLGLDASGSSAAEIGARRHAGRGWRDGIAAAMVEMSRVLRPRGRAVLLVGDGIENDRPVSAGQAIREVGQAAGLSMLAAASQTRPTWSGAERRLLGPTKKETLVAMEKP